jgi:hypothetical protein
MEGRSYLRAFERKKFLFRGTFVQVSKYVKIPCKWVISP